jgi:hypothetical protein
MAVESTNSQLKLDADIAVMQRQLDGQKAEGELQLIALRNELVERAIRGLVGRNPVLTGESRGDWKAFVNSMGAERVHNPELLDPDGSSTIREMEAVLHSAPTYCEIWLSNVTPYIVLLEEGRSDKSPDGILRSTVQELTAVLRSQRNLALVAT